jgi:hypothetical protein
VIPHDYITAWRADFEEITFAIVESGLGIADRFNDGIGRRDGTLDVLVQTYQSPDAGGCGSALSVGLITRPILLSAWIKTLINVIR